MKIAFTSCCDTDNDATQVAWDRLAALAPDVIVLLGDTIYMDYAWPEHKWHNGAPRAKPLADFSQRMHSLYARQWSVASFARAIRSAQVQVHAIWDDHDFGFNNARAGGHAPDDPEWMRPDMRRLARRLFEQFRQALVDKPAAYPPNPCPDGVVADDLGGIQGTVDLGPRLRLHLVDGRSFREPRGKQASLLGAAQRDALASHWLPRPGINLVASGTTLEDWGKYSDRAWLFGQAQGVQILVISGDIHKKHFLAEAPVYEVIASAMAQPPRVTAAFGKRTEVFGLLEMTGTAVEIDLYREDRQPERHRIDLAQWAEEFTA